MTLKKEATICSVGDLMICDSPLYVGVGVASAFSQIKDHLFDECQNEFHSADLVIGNLEGAVYQPKRNNLSEKQMSSPQESLTILRNAGFSVLNIANNHCLQHGTASFLQTREACSNAGIRAIGIKNEVPFVTVINGIRLVFLSFCILPEVYQPEDVQFENDIKAIIHRIDEYKRSDTFIVLSIHWGNEFATFPPQRQIKLAHKLVDHGVDILLGHHPHVYQGIEFYKGALIAYSQGNFISDMVPELCRNTGILKIKVSLIDDQKSISYNFESYYINDKFIPEHSNNTWFEDRQKELDFALKHEESDQKYNSTVSIMHKQSRREFQVKFRKDFFKYRPNVSLKMLFDAFIRKLTKKKMPILNWDKIFSDIDNIE